MPSDSKPSALSNLLSPKVKDPLGAAVEEVAAAWSTYEAGMDWDPSYLDNLGTLDMDTDEYHAFFTATEELDRLLAQEGERASSLTRAAIARLFDAKRTFENPANDTPEQTARQISAALRVPFAGRHGGGSSNNPC